MVEELEEGVRESGRIAGSENFDADAMFVVKRGEFEPGRASTGGNEEDGGFGARLVPAEGVLIDMGGTHGIENVRAGRSILGVEDKEPLVIVPRDAKNDIRNAETRDGTSEPGRGTGGKVQLSEEFGAAAITGAGPPAGAGGVPVPERKGGGKAATEFEETPAFVEFPGWTGPEAVGGVVGLETRAESPPSLAPGAGIEGIGGNCGETGGGDFGAGDVTEGGGALGEFDGDGELFEVMAAGRPAVGEGGAGGT